MNVAEKIAALEALLVRVQKRAQEPRPARAALPVAAAPAVAPVEATPPVSEAQQIESSSDNIEVDISLPTTPSLQREEPKKVEAVHVSVPAPVTLAKGASGSYAAKGGMSEELPDFDLEEEEEEEGQEGEELEQGEDEIALDQSAPAANTAVQAEESEAEEFDIPSRLSVQMRSVAAPAPIEVPRDDEALELDHRPLASALPTSTEGAIEPHSERSPPSTVPAVIEPADAQLILSSAPQFKTPAETALDEPELTMVSSENSLPEPPVEEAIPLVATPKPAAVEPAKAPAPVVVTPAAVAPVAPPVVTPPAKPVLVPAPNASGAPVAPVQASVVHEPVALSASEPVVSVVSEPAAPAAPLSFADLLRRSLALRVK